jgi:hypothetical protein
LKSGISRRNVQKSQKKKAEKSTQLDLQILLLRNKETKGKKCERERNTHRRTQKIQKKSEGRSCEGTVKEKKSEALCRRKDNNTNKQEKKTGNSKQNYDGQNGETKKRHICTPGAPPPLWKKKKDEKESQKKERKAGV